MTIASSILHQGLRCSGRCRTWTLAGISRWFQFLENCRSIHLRQYRTSRTCLDHKLEPLSIPQSSTITQPKVEDPKVEAIRAVQIWVAISGAPGYPLCDSLTPQTQMMNFTIKPDVHHQDLFPYIIAACQGGQYPDGIFMKSWTDKNDPLKDLKKMLVHPIQLGEDGRANFETQKVFKTDDSGMDWLLKRLRKEDFGKMPCVELHVRGGWWEPNLKL